MVTFNCGIGTAKGFPVENDGGTEKFGIEMLAPWENGSSTADGNTNGTYESSSTFLDSSSSLSLASKVQTLFAPNFTFLLPLFSMDKDFVSFGVKRSFFANALFCGKELGVPGAGGCTVVVSET